MIELKKENGIAWLTMNRPELHNAFNDEVIDQFILHLKDISKDESLRLIILKGNGKSFCAGADINWMSKMKDYSAEENYRDSLKLADLFEFFDNVKLPIVGLVHGHALGGGVGLVSICDYVLASEKAKFGFTEARLGLAPCVISPFVVRKIGESEARAWFFSGERFSAARAYDMKLVHEVVSESEFEERSNQVVKSFLKAAPNAGKVGKVFLRLMLDTKKNKRKEFTARSIAELRVLDEGQEGMKSLLEKRKPSWVK